jgi:hypothetical protein
MKHLISQQRMTKPPSSETKPQRAPRFLAALPAVIHVEGRDLPAQAGDISRSGALLECRMEQPTTPDLDVTLATATGDRSVRLAARIMHAHQRGESLRLGVQFGDMTAAQSETLALILSRVVEGLAPAALSDIDPAASLTEIRAALGRISQAHRTALAARTTDPGERGILRQDTDPHVLEALARNPNSNLPEIKNLLRRTELLPSTLELIATDPRWPADEELKVMIATHPRVTFVTADRVASQLTDLGRDRLVRRPGLQAGVKQKLMTQLSRKHRGPN